MKLYRQQCIAIIFSLLSSYSFACAFDCNHPYFGGTVGVISLTDKQKTVNPILDAHRLGIAGATGGVLLGYDFNLCNQWKFGLEGFASADSLHLSTNQNYAPEASYTVKMRHHLGIRILPGYAFSRCTTGHLILGYSSGSFKIHDNGNYGYVKKHFSKNGFQLGLGLEAVVCQHLSIRGDAIYTNYAGQTSRGITTATPPTRQFYHNRFSTLEGDLSLVYNM